MGKGWERGGKVVGKGWERGGKGVGKGWERGRKGVGKGWERGGFVLLIIIRGDCCSPVDGGVPHAAIVRVHVDLSSDTTHLTTLTALLHLSPHLQILCHSWTLSVNSTATLTVSGYRTETIVTLVLVGIGQQQ